MREISGVLKMLGSGTAGRNQAGKSFVFYTSIEIGDTIVQKVRTAQSLGDYVERGLGQEVTLYFNGNVLIGVKLPNGKVYYWKRSLLVPILCALICILVAGGLIGATHSVALPVLGVAAVWALICRNELTQVLSAQPKLAHMGGVGLKS